MSLNLFLAGMWLIVGLGLLLVPTASESYFAGLDAKTRIWLGGFALVLACYNVIRWRCTRIRRQLDEESRSYRRPPSHHHREEPPNPDFDFSEHGPDKPPPPS